MQFLQLTVLMMASTPLFAGCFMYVSFGNPLAAVDPAAEGALVTVSVLNCAGQFDGHSQIGFPTAKTKVIGNAEGLVDGRRVSLPLKVTKLRSSGMSAIHWETPKEGVWLLNLKIVDPGDYYIGGSLQNILGVLVPVRRDGVERRPKPVQHPATSSEIDAALDKLALEARQI